MLNAVIIVLREVLEAAMLVSILCAMSVLLGVRRHWTAWALATGLAGALLLGYGVDTVSEWFDGVGQEVLSATLQIIIYLLLGCIIVLMQSGNSVRAGKETLLPLCMGGAVACAVTREGYEILIYVYGFALHEQVNSVLVGLVIGTGIGVSAGALIYYLMLAVRPRWSRIGGQLLLILAASGMLSQAAQLLIQADWLPALQPLWDSSGVLPESSVTGQLLYALLGYEATPSAIQVGSYLGGVLLLLVLALAATLHRRRGGLPRAD